MNILHANVARLLSLLLILSSIVWLGGCRICADCEDMAYPAFGGAWQRTQPNSGRVGSLFDPGGAKASELVSRDEPPAPDELERERQQARGGASSDPDMDRDEDDEVKPDPDEQEMRDREDELRRKQLDDIEEEMQDELEKKGLDDINVRIVPGQPMPPVLQ